MNSKKALIAGSSGLVGSKLIHYLLERNAYEKVYAIVRRPLEMKHSKLIEVITDFDQLRNLNDAVFQVDDVFCCLGTTMKKAKTKEAMYKIDVEYPVALAKRALEQGARHYLVISAMGANPRSPVWYSKMKGQLEEQLKALEFEALSILQPSLLIGDRNEFRFWESVAMKLAKLYEKLSNGRLHPKFAIQAETVALAMYEFAQVEKKGAVTYHSVHMNRIVKDILVNVSN